MHQPPMQSLARGAFRAALLRSAAAGAIALAAAAPAQAGPDACVGVGGPNVTCTGDQSDGIAQGPPGEVFNVNTLTTNITPATNTTGIFIFSTGGPITLTSATGPFSINASGAFTSGILVRNFGAGLSTITQSGDITSGYIGLSADSVDATSVINLNAAGNITSFNGAIDIHAGNNASVISSGDLISTNAFGIQAESLFNAVTVESSSAITAAGVGIIATAQLSASVIVQGTIQAGLSGVEIQSAAGNIDVTISAAGVVTGGNAGTAGVVMSGGAGNLLQNFGSISGLNGTAIVAGVGNDEVRNSGILIGNIELDIGTNALNNLAPGLFLSGNSVNVGDGNTLSNLGMLSPGNTGTIQTTAITGNLTQGPSGRLILDINPATGENDRINVTGNSTLAGSVVPNLLDSVLLYKQFLIISSAGALSFAGLAVTDDSAAYDYSLRAVGNDLFLDIELVSIPGLIVGPLTPNQRATVQYLNRLLLADPGPALTAFLESLVGLPTDAAIIAALDRLRPEAYLAAVTTTLQSSQLFFDSLMSCPSALTPGVVARDGQCYWARIQGRTTGWDRTRTTIGGSEDAGGVEGGLQAFLAPDWLLGAAISYEHSTIDTGNPASLEGDRAQGGLVTKGLFGDTTLAAALFGGYGWFDAERPIGLPAPGVIAEGEQDIGFGGAGLRISHLLDRGGWYLKPMADATVTYISYGNIRESGAGVANLIVDGEQDMVINLAAALEIGSVIAIDAGRTLRPYLRAGLSAASQSDFSLTSRFDGAPSGIAPFTVTSHTDNVLAAFGAGLDLFDVSGVSLNLSYDGRFGDHTDAHAGSAKLRMAF